MTECINLHQLLTVSDLERGYKKLKRKKKYKDPRGKGILPRYISAEQREENLLKKFLERDVKTLEQRSNFYDSLSAYKPQEYSAYAIDKGGGKGFRPLLVPVPSDRLVFDSVLPKYFELLKEPLAKRELLGIGLIKKQKVSDILKRIYSDHVSKGYHFALEIDYSSFFSNIDREILFTKFASDFGEGLLYTLLKLSVCNEIKNGIAVQEKTKIKITENGIPQGLSFSPLIACYYALDIDDIYISDTSVVGYRYIDDIIIFAKKEKDLLDVYKKIEAKSLDLKMKLHPLGVPDSKTQLTDLDVNPVTFLGVELSPSKGLVISEKKFEEIIKIIKSEIFNIRIILNKNEAQIKKVYYDYMSGWLNHYEQIHPNPAELHKKIDSLVYDQYFKKRKVRKRFYKKYPWIKVSKNEDLLKRSDK